MFVFLIVVLFDHHKNGSGIEVLGSENNWHGHQKAYVLFKVFRWRFGKSSGIHFCLRREEVVWRSFWNRLLNCSFDAAVFVKVPELRPKLIIVEF